VSYAHLNRNLFWTYDLYFQQNYSEIKLRQKF